LTSGKGCALRLPPGVGWRPPRRAGLAPQKPAKQAAPDRPVHSAVLALRALLTSSQACLRHAGALAARRWFQRIPWPIGRCSSFPKFIAFSRDLSPQCLAVKARRAESSQRCGPHQPCASSLTASPSPARFFAGDELRKDGGKQGPAQVSAPNQPKPQRAPNLGIRSAL